MRRRRQAPPRFQAGAPSGVTDLDAISDTQLANGDAARCSPEPDTSDLQSQMLYQSMGRLETRDVGGVADPFAEGAVMANCDGAYSGRACRCETSR